MAGTFFHTAHPHTLTDMRLTLLTQIVIFWEKIVSTCRLLIFGDELGAGAICGEYNGASLRD